MRELRFAELRIDGQRQRLCSRPLGLRKIPGPIAEILEALLQMQRHGIVNLGADALLTEEFLQIVAPGDAYDVLIVDVPAARLRHRR